MNELKEIAKSYDKVYLIANNPYINHKIFNIITDNDLVICFNHDQNRNILTKKNIKNKILVMRYWQRRNTWHGYNISHNNTYIKTYFLFGTWNNYNFLNYRDRKCFINYDKIEYPEFHTPTTGFYIWYNLKDILERNKIICIGYTYKEGTPPEQALKEGWFGHLVLYEKFIMEKCKTINI